MKATNSKFGEATKLLESMKLGDESIYDEFTPEEASKIADSAWARNEIRKRAPSLIPTGSKDEQGSAEAISDASDEEPEAEEGAESDRDEDEFPPEFPQVKFQQVWDFPLSRKEQHLRLNQMQDVARVDEANQKKAMAEQCRKEKAKALWEQDHAIEADKLLRKAMRKVHLQGVQIQALVEIVDQAFAVPGAVMSEEVQAALRGIRQEQGSSSGAGGARFDKKEKQAQSEPENVERPARFNAADAEEEHADLIAHGNVLIAAIDRDHAAFVRRGGGAAAAPPAAAEAEAPAIQDQGNILTRTKGMLLDMMTGWEI